MSKFGKHYPNGGFILKSANDCLAIRKKIEAEQVTKSYYTTARSVFLGYKGRTLANAQSLKDGYFKKEIGNVTTTDLPVASDMVHFTVPAGGNVRIEYELVPGHDEALAEQQIQTVPDICLLYTSRCV